MTNLVFLLEKYSSCISGEHKILMQLVFCNNNSFYTSRLWSTFSRAPGGSFSGTHSCMCTLGALYLTAELPKWAVAPWCLLSWCAAEQGRLGSLELSYSQALTEHRGLQAAAVNVIMGEPRNSACSLTPPSLTWEGSDVCQHTCF